MIAVLFVDAQAHSALRSATKSVSYRFLHVWLHLVQKHFAASRIVIAGPNDLFPGRQFGDTEGLASSFVDTDSSSERTWLPRCLDCNTSFVLCHSASLFLAAEVWQDAAHTARRYPSDGLIVEANRPTLCYVGKALLKDIFASSIARVDIPIFQLLRSLAAIDRSVKSEPIVRVLPVRRYSERHNAPLPTFFTVPAPITGDVLLAALQEPTANPQDKLLALERRHGARARGHLRRNRRMSGRQDVQIDTPTVLITVLTGGLSGNVRAWQECLPLLQSLTRFRLHVLVGTEGPFVKWLRIHKFQFTQALHGLDPTSTADLGTIMKVWHSHRPAIVHFDGVEGSHWNTNVQLLGSLTVQHVRYPDLSGYRGALATADAVISVSRAVADRVRLARGSHGLQRVITDGIDLRRWQRSPNAAREHAALGLGTHPVIVVAGRIEPRKRQLEAIQAVCSLRRARILV